MEPHATALWYWLHCHGERQPHGQWSQYHNAV